MKNRLVALPIALLVLALPVGFAGCGGGGEEELPPVTETPELLPPSSVPTTSSTGTGTTGTLTTGTTGKSTSPNVRTIEEGTPDGGGGDDVEAEPAPEPKPEPEDTQAPPKKDPGSSAERFEQFCASDPKSCGN
jgi:hypothetical protein